MRRAYGERADPKATVKIGEAIYRSTGRLQQVLPHRTGSGKIYAALLVDLAWMYADPRDDERAWGMINEPVAVTWNLAYGRRYVRDFRRLRADES